MSGLQRGIGMFVMMEYIFPTFEGEQISVGLFSVILFGYSTYIFRKLKLTKINNI